MMQHRVAIYLIATCAAFTPASSSFALENQAVRDDAGAEVAMPGAAKRIVSLAPNLTELTYAAGAGAKLVAVTRYSDYPAAAKKLPIVGDAFAINLEAIARLKPDLVLVWQSGTPERQRAALKALGARQGFAVYESEIRTVDGIASTLERIGALAGTDAKPSAAQFKADWAALAAQYQNAKPVRVFYQVWDAPLMTFNGEHLVSTAIKTCGGVQGFDNLSALTPTVSREAVAAFNPQLILSGDPSAKALAAWKKLPQVQAVKNAQLKTVDGAVLTRMGPRFVQASHSLCEVIHASRLALK
jgi:iron complex transport system substrate-binding protein